MAVHDPCTFFDESLRGRERAFLFRERLNDRSNELGWRPAGRLSPPSDRLLVDGHHTSPILRNETFVTLWWRSSSVAPSPAKGEGTQRASVTLRRPVA